MSIARLGDFGEVLGPDEGVEMVIQSHGSFFAKSGIALVRHGDEFYRIDPKRPEGEKVYQLSGDELRNVHMMNLHLDSSRQRLSAEEIGEFPFVDLLTRLERESRLANCDIYIDSFLDPLESRSLKLRRLYAQGLEDLLREIPRAHGIIMARMQQFIPPEGYEVPLDQLTEETKQEGREFAVVFPHLFEILGTLQPVWTENIERFAEQRLTRTQIQDHHDNTVEEMSRNLLSRAQRIHELFKGALEELREGHGSWGLDSFPLRDKKGSLNSLLRHLPRDQVRLEEAEVRRSGLLARYERAASLVEESKRLLREIEEILGGEIEGVRYS